MDDAARDRIRAKLDLLGRRDRQRPHGDELGPTLSEDALRAFEAEHGVCLPAGYRRFLRELGEGGAGPGWGLVSLRAWADAWDGFVAAPEPGSMARPVSVPDQMDPAHLVSQLRGWMTLADQGAERWWLLEVTGELPGRVWLWESLETAPRPFAPFADWYERWLDESIAGLDDRSFGAFPPGTDTELLLRSADPDPAVRAQTAGELGRRLQPSEGVRAGLRQLMRDPDRAVRAAALRHGTNAVDEGDVLLGLEDPDVEVQRAAAFLLRRGGPQPGAPALLGLLPGFEDPTVFSLVGRVLGERGQLPSAALADVLSRGHAPLRARAVALLELVTPPSEADTWLERGLADEDAAVRKAAVLAVANRPGWRTRLSALHEQEKDPGVRDALTRALSDADPG